MKGDVFWIVLNIALGLLNLYFAIYIDKELWLIILNTVAGSFILMVTILTIFVRIYTKNR